MANNVKYIAKYQKANTIQVNLRLNKKYDADIIEYLNALGDKGKCTYLKELIRKDMNKASDACKDDNAEQQSAEKADNELSITEVSVAIDTGVPTLSNWYRWKKQNPEHPKAKLLPDFHRVGPHGARYWYESDIQGLIDFKKSIKQGRYGIMGSVTQKYVKKSKGHSDREEGPKTQEQVIKEALAVFGLEKAKELGTLYEAV